MPPITLAAIAAALKVPLPSGADGDRLVSGLAALDDARGDELSMVSTPAYAKGLAGSAAGVVLVHHRLNLNDPAKVLLPVENVEAAVSIVLSLFAPPADRPAPGVDSAARIDPAACVGENPSIGPNVVVGAGCRLGRNVVLHPGVVIGQDVTVGDDCQLHAHVVLRERVILGDRVIVHAGSVIGTDGFGYRWDGAGHRKVPHIGTVVIEDDVEIGSCAAVDRAKFGITRIGRGTKIDNLVQVAHNVQVGPHCILVAQVGIAGSSTLGTGVVLGGQTAVRDHVTIGDGAIAAARTAIAADVPARTSVSGMPALPHRQSLREQAAFRRLPELLVQVRQLQDEIERLQAQR